LRRTWATGGQTSVVATASVSERTESDMPENGEYHDGKGKDKEKYNKIYTRSK